ncbi:PA0069 family radical SAM protein [Kordiimonas gwangyangensis]|uniref:PA0069 family radical SAM protein n=1 Tax=Kordiimonas gwangyangensis TaxID=288022 RepID=UPI0003807761|nr:PA0069 family radical SAM protein [Kordiimonas gwangyangensis]
METGKRHIGLGQPSTSPWLVRGRGAVSNNSGRFEKLTRERADDGWLSDIPDASLKTEVQEEQAKHILTRNKSPDIPFDRSINPYRGCEHGCVYCFARPTHAYMGLSPGIDFETKLFAKPNAAELLKAELSKKGYEPKPIAMGTNTDPYQPIEKDRRITREILKVLYEHRHPVTILTKSRLVVRDMDILVPMAEMGLVRVSLSVTTLDRKLARALEPRASTPTRRLDAIKLLADAGVPTGMMFAPVIPALNDHEMETLLSAGAHAGAKYANYILLRLPLELGGLFEEWLGEHYPDRKVRVLHRLMEMRGGRVNDPRFKHRMKGKGLEADLMDQRFRNISRRLGLNLFKQDLDTTKFRRPVLAGGQFNLFDHTSAH